MAAEKLGKIFLANESTTTKGTAGESGTGFGLPIVMSILQKFQAAITVDSKSQKSYPDEHGTQFTVSFKKSHLQPTTKGVG